ncbi:hypothetical protein GCM10023325_08560 [Sphingomonas lutea]
MTQSQSNPTVRVATILATCVWKPCPTYLALGLSAGSHPDFITENHGTIWTFLARTRAAQDWWAENVGDGPCLGRNCCVDHHHAQAILVGLQRDGFTTQSGRSQ